ncbi:MAG TPA: site-specific DNA-methyltransferase [Methylomirabilota bacterium]|nr:site-specific DNA-methyltransferase [Methylomirabilota bacterium]
MVQVERREFELHTTADGHRKRECPSTVGRGKSVSISSIPAISIWQGRQITAQLGNSLDFYAVWPRPTLIISDGPYGVLGYEGDTSDHLALPSLYEPHISAWAGAALPSTTLWFWNSEIGWAAVHPVLERYGWRYENCNIWNKGKGHIAGNVNTGKIRRFPVVSEVCVQYVFETRVQGKRLREWLLSEWKRTGLTLREANTACGVADAAVRKYLDQGHLWYYPPPEMFEKLQRYANLHGNPIGKPYFSIDGKHPATAKEWMGMRSKFRCPHGFTNVWDRPALHGKEREKVNGFNGRAVHLNQKPFDLMHMLIEATTDPEDVVWEPFGGLFTACLAAAKLRRRAYGAEIDPTYFHFGVQRLSREAFQQPLPL